MTAITAAGIAVNNAADVTQQAAIGMSRQLAAESLATDPTNPLTARQLAVAAWSVSPTDQAESTMLTLLAEQQQDGLLPATSTPNDLGGLVAGVETFPATTALNGVAEGNPGPSARTASCWPDRDEHFVIS